MAGVLKQGPYHGIGNTGVEASAPLLLCCFPLPHEGPDQ
jgi:hypothetical protein